MLEEKMTFCLCGNQRLRSHFLHGTRTRILLRFVRRVGTSADTLRSKLRMDAACDEGPIQHLNPCACVSQLAYTTSAHCFPRAEPTIRLAGKALATLPTSPPWL